MYEAIMDALRRGAGAEAVTAAREAVADAPDDAIAHRWLATALRETGEHDAALASIDHAISLAPEQASLHMERAGLLLQARDLDAAQAALARASGLDPNQFPAYILQAQLALGRGDLVEVERLMRLASRIAPEHAHVAALEGMVALRRGDAQRALSILTAATKRDPGDMQLRYALGFAYLEAGHLAFAEQAFQGIVDNLPHAKGLRGLLAELMRRQGRVGDAAQVLQPLLDSNAATPALRRFAGELHLAAGDHEAALPLLRNALAAQPQDRRTLLVALEAWRRAGDRDGARNALEAALATTLDAPDLWRGRLAVEGFGSPEAAAIGERWIAAMPNDIAALEARMALHATAGQDEQADAIARHIIAIEPGRSSAELRLLERLMAGDPAAAVARLRELIATATTDESKQLLRSWLGIALDRAGQYAEAVAAWLDVARDSAPQRLPLAELTPALSMWPELAPLPEQPPMVLLLWGAPGSGVERIAGLFEAAGGPFRADRFGPSPPQDRLQSVFTAAQLISGETTAQQLVADWRAALPARGIPDGNVIDWLPWWDNALLLALRPQLPEAVLMIALRDPRDMLLDWLAFSAPAPFALASLPEATKWLAGVLEQVADLHEQDLFPHRLLKLDESMDDAQALAAAVGAALEVDMPLPAGPLGTPRLGSGRWRAYAQVMAGPFAQLAPVARRLGYADA